MNKIFINIAGIRYDSTGDGLGMRVVVFFQGCPHRCKGCHNSENISFDGGNKMTISELFDKIMVGINPLIKGVTFSGGEPFAQPEGLYKIIKMLREKTNLNIWVYTGYNFDEVKYFPAMKEIDVLVDGRFIEEKKDLFLPFRGSSNQRLIDVPKTLALGKIIEVRV